MIRPQPILLVALSVVLWSPLEAAAQGWVNVSTASGLSVPAWGGFGGSGRGAAWGDFDNDGDMDLFATGGPNRPIQVHRNNGNGTFSPAPLVAGPSATRRDHGVACADIDNDGDLDVYVCEGSFQPNLLFLNDGTGNFSEVGVAAGVASTADSSMATFGDFDRDGFVDLYVANYFSLTNPLGADNILYHNNGDGTFTDVTAATGLSAPGYTYACLFCDYDRDGWPDIWVGNDRGNFGYPPDAVFRNLRNGTFANVATAINAAAPIAAMGITQGDVHNDGDWDYYLTNEPPGHVLHVFDSATGTFELPASDYLLTASNYGVAVHELGWSCGFFDYDNDGILDLFVTHTSGAVAPNKLFKGTAGNSFTDVTLSSGFGLASSYVYSGSVCDFDDDGDLDFFAAGDNLASQLVRNDAATGNWLRVKLIGTVSNRDAIGATIIATTGATRRMRMITSGEGFLSESDRRALFGLGSATVVDRLEIRWPSGTIEYRENVAVNQTLSITEPRFNVSGGYAPGTISNVSLNLPTEAGLIWVHVLTSTTVFESTLADGRIIRTTSGDPFLQASLDPNNGVLFFNGGLVSAMAPTTSVLVLPNLPILSGLPLNWMAFTIDANFANGLKTIVGPQTIVIN